MKAPISALLLLGFLGSACSVEAATSPEPTPPAAAPAAATGTIATAELHDAICGCALPGVGRCGNYVKIDESFVVLEWPELGKMEYCAEGKKGAKVEITGAMKDGRFVAATYKRVE
jgi:hypothetical protein